jgi:heptosyltransferase-1
MASGPLAGYDWSSIREPLASLWYDKRYAISRDQSAVERNRQLFARVFGYTVGDSVNFGIRPGDRPLWLPEQRYVVLLHATSRASKEWPEHCWTALGERLKQQYALLPVLPWGNASERERAERLAASLPGAIVAPRMGLTEAAGLLGNARAVVGVDTGLTHLANALDIPLVAIYTDTDPQKTGVIETPSATNLGGIGQLPSVEQVVAALSARKDFS